MAKGIIYLMSTVVDGLVKIGKTKCDQYENRMYTLENNGYRNVSGLRREFAIEVEDYDEKEILLDNIFEKSRVGDTELFSLNLNLAKQLLSALDGNIVYPKIEKKEIFEIATEAVNISSVPDGKYYMSGINKKAEFKYKAEMSVIKGKITLLKGSLISPVTAKGDHGWLREREKAKILNNVLQEDFGCQSFSMASCIVVGHNDNGWTSWKNSNGEFIDIFRIKA